MLEARRVESVYVIVGNHRINEHGVVVRATTAVFVVVVVVVAATRVRLAFNATATASTAAIVVLGAVDLETPRHLISARLTHAPHPQSRTHTYARTYRAGE